MIEATKQEERQEEFQTWLDATKENLQVGDVGSKLTPSQKEDYHRLIFAFKDVIAENPKKPRLLKGIVHRILLDESKDCTPWQEYVRRCSPAEEEVKAKEILEMLKNDIIEHCNSEWANNLVVVKKADGTPRVCVDFRRLNEVSRIDPFPLARIDDAFEAMGKSKIFTALDCAAAFWSCPLAEEDKDKTAFVTRQHGQLRFKRMPFGLKNATATYSRALQHVCRGLLWTAVIQYVDDVAVMGESHDDHLEKVGKVLRRFELNGVSIKMSKCKFGISEMEFLGHLVVAA